MQSNIGQTGVKSMNLEKKSIAKMEEVYMRTNIFYKCVALKAAGIIMLYLCGVALAKQFRTTEKEA